MLYANFKVCDIDFSIKKVLLMASTAVCYRACGGIHFTGSLDLVSNKSVLKMENNPWVTPIADQLQVGVSHVMEYIRTETYR